MRILVDFGHPAHVHIFKHFAQEMDRSGHQFLFTCREKECMLNLIKASGFEVISFGKPYKNYTGKIWGLFRFNLRMLHVFLKYRPDLTLGHSSMYAAQISWFFGITHISIEDTGNMEQIRLYRPFTKAILVPESFHLNLGKKQIRYSGNHELAYLHPNRFIPDPAILFNLIPNHQFNTSPGSPFTDIPIYSILRFVAWNASHDRGHSGISYKNKRKAIETFSRFGKVFISSENELPKDLEPFRLPTPPEKFHDVLAYASLVYGESATVASEACILGVPAIYLDNIGRCYTREEEKFGLAFNFTESEEDQEKSIQKGVELLSTARIKEEWQIRRDRFISKKIDVTTFLVWFIENWPESMKIMKETPDYQYNFK